MPTRLPYLKGTSQFLTTGGDEEEEKEEGGKGGWGDLQKVKGNLGLHHCKKKKNK